MSDEPFSGSPDTRLPVTLLTGFLGSGKTTLLNRLVRDEAFSDSVVIINEFGEIALDNLLVEHVDETMRVLNNGCICCTVRGDLIDTLLDLKRRREEGEIAFSRVVIETTGLADPAPIIHSLTVDPSLTLDWLLKGVITTADAVNGPSTLKTHVEAARQAGVADTIVLTKTDLSDGVAVSAFRSTLQTLNPQAAIVTSFDDGLLAILGDASHIYSWREASDETDGHHHDDHDHDHDHDEHHHYHDTSGVTSLSLTFESPMAEAALMEWLELLTSLKGENLLRVKGIVCVEEEPSRPRVIQSVQHVVHPVALLDRWPTEDRSTSIVFITQDMDLSLIRRTFQQYAVEKKLAHV